MAIWIPADVPAGKANALAYVMHIKAEEKAAKSLASTWAGRQGLIARNLTRTRNMSVNWDIYDNWAYTYPDIKLVFIFLTIIFVLGIAISTFTSRKY